MSDPTPPSLQAQMDQLNTLVERLEDPEIPLEEALVLYERGMGLIEQAQKTLDAAEQTVRVINANGEEQALEE